MPEPPCVLLDSLDEVGVLRAYLRFLSFFFSSRRRHTRFDCDWSSDVCSSDLGKFARTVAQPMDRANRTWRARCECRLRRRERLSGRGRSTDAGAYIRRREDRSEERRVGKEWRSRWSPYH